MQLSEIQTRFKDVMLDHPDTLNHPEEGFSSLFNEGDIPLPARLKVYRNNIVGSLTDVMIAGFPLIDNLVGREFMEMTARSFILKNPPQQGCLNFYGTGFDEFLEEFEPARSLPYLPDVARLEIALNDAYYAPDDDGPLKVEDIADIAPEDLPGLALTPRSSVRLISSRYPLDEIRALCLSQDEKDETLNIDKGDVRLMIFRPALDTQVINLERGEFAMLSAILAGHTLGDALEKTLNTYEDFDFQPFLQKHLALETFATLPANG